MYEYGTDVRKCKYLGLSINLRKTFIIGFILNYMWIGTVVGKCKVPKIKHNP